MLVDYPYGLMLVDYWVQGLVVLMLLVQLYLVVIFFVIQTTFLYLLNNGPTIGR